MFKSPLGHVFEFILQRRLSRPHFHCMASHLSFRDIHIVTVSCASRSRTPEAATHFSTLTFTGPGSARELGPEVPLVHCQAHYIRPYVIRPYAWRR